MGIELGLGRVLEPHRVPSSLAFAHDRDRQGHLSDGHLRLDIGHPDSGVGLLVLDDESQSGVELVGTMQARGCFTDATVETYAARRARKRRATPLWRRTTGTAWVARLRLEARPRRGSVWSGRCGRAPLRWRRVSGASSTCLPRPGLVRARRASTISRHERYKLFPKCHAVWMPMSMTFAAGDVSGYQIIDAKPLVHGPRPGAAGRLRNALEVAAVTLSVISRRADSDD